MARETTVVVPRFGKAVMAIFSVIVVVALAAEAGLRIAGKHDHFPTACRWNPRIGCVLDPNLSKDIAVEYPFHFTTNSEGRRDRERGPKRPGQTRVLLLGDSVAFGVPVADEETIAARVEARLGGKVEVINAGSPYLRGTDQQLSYFLDVGAALEPDLILVEFTAQNDFDDIEHHYFWQPARGGGIERVDHRDPPTLKHRLVALLGRSAVMDFLEDHSALVGAVQLHFWHLMHLPAATSYDWNQSTEDVIARFQLEAAHARAKLAIVLVPSPRLLNAIRHHEPLPDRLDERAITDITARHGVPLLDLTSILAAASEATPLETNDGHLTREGYDRAAAEIAPHLDEWLRR